MPLTRNHRSSWQQSAQASSLAPGAIYGTNFEIQTGRKMAVFIMVSWSLFWTLPLSSSAQSAHAPAPGRKTAHKENLADKEKRQRAALVRNANHRSFMVNLAER